MHGDAPSEAFYGICIRGNLKMSSSPACLRKQKGKVFAHIIIQTVERKFHNDPQKY
jgi:hypothetical protein